MKRKTIIHTLIIISFLLYLLSANYIFNKLITIEKESKLQNIYLIEETNDITFNIDDIQGVKRKWKEFIQISGWGLISNRNSENNKIYIVLESKNKTYVFDTTLKVREDVAEIYSNIDFNNSGYLALISKDVIKDGKYRIGIYIESDNNKSLIFSNSYFTKSKNDIFKRFISSAYQLQLPDDETKNINYSLDKIEDVSEGQKEFIEINGWAFIDGRSSDNEEKYIVLKSEGNTYFFDVVLQNRPDVTRAFKGISNLDLDNSGFIATIPKGSIKNGEYSIGIYIKDENVDYLQYTGRRIKY